MNEEEKKKRFGRHQKLTVGFIGAAFLVACSFGLAEPTEGFLRFLDWWGNYTEVLILGGLWGLIGGGAVVNTARTLRGSPKKKDEA